MTQAARLQWDLMFPEAVAVADFNRDGILDLATSNDNTNQHHGACWDSVAGTR